MTSLNISAMNGDQALERLMEGNKRYVNANLANPNRTLERMQELVQGQSPSAVIVGCSDSRVPPEIIFDQGLGDLFIVRVAGNIVDDAALGSIEYAVSHLGVQLVLVLGHEKCGAVAAAVEESAAEVPGKIGSLIELIKPAVEKAKHLSGDLVDNAARMNVKMVVDKLSSANPILADKVGQGSLKVAGAYYYLDNGSVDLIS